MSTVAHLSSALGAKGLSPGAKLILILIAARADMDGHVFAPHDDLIESANVSPDRFEALMFELAQARAASYGRAEHPSTQVMTDCILFAGADDGR